MKQTLARHGWRLFILLVIVFLVAPLILVILFSFNASALTSLPLTGFTLDGYDFSTFNPSDRSPSEAIHVLPDWYR